MRKYAVLLAVFALLGSQPIWATDTGSSATDSLAHEQSLINQANEKLQSKDWRGAQALLKQISEDDGFSLLDDETQHSVFHFLASTAYQNKDDETARQAIRRACSYAQAAGGDWRLRFSIAARRHDDDDSVTSFTTLAEKWPAELADFYDQTIFFVSHKATTLPAGKERQAKLLRALFAIQWKPTDDASDGADYLWLDLIRFDLKWGDQTQIAKLAAVITNPNVITTMRIEKQFDAITTADPARFDLANAYVQALARAQARMSAHPELLDAVYDVANYFVRMDRPSEALALLDEALARIRRAGTGKPPFSDVEDKLNWIYDIRARALLSLDRVDEGVAQFAQAARLSEHGTPNVSQTINLADAYYLLGRPKDTLAALADFKGNTSPFGQMQFEEARACAYAQLNDAENLTKSMAYIDAHTADAPGVKLDVSICAGDLDGAAKTAITQLGDPELVSPTLLSLQIYAKPHLVHESAFKRTLDARWDALRARTDVLAAVANVGRIEHLPVVDEE
ncbi:MAG: hypothetical protein WCA81_03760 [Rhizomicrobium sp.]